MTSDLRDARTPSTTSFEFSPHHCFACGTLNDTGLHMTLHLEEGRAWSTTELDHRFGGWEGIAHGGIVSTILDEVMGWALISGDDWGVTAKLSVRFRQPVPLAAPIRADGWVTASRRRIFETSGRLIDQTTGVELATADGTYVSADPKRKAELRERYGFRFRDDLPGPVARG